MAGDVSLEQLHAMQHGYVAQLTTQPYVPVMDRGPQDTAHSEMVRLLELSAKQAAEIERLRQVWEDTRTQRDELLAHIAGKGPLPKWAADWLKA